MSSANLSPARIKQLNAAVLGAVVAIVVTQCTPRLLGLGGSPAAPPGETFVMTRTGGIGGEHLILVVNRYGTYIVNRAGTDRPPATGTLTSQDLEGLRKAVGAADLDQAKPVHSDRCADQLHYTFSYGDSYYATDDCPRAPSAVERLTHQLAPLIALYYSRGAE